MALGATLCRHRTDISPFFFGDDNFSPKFVHTSGGKEN